MNKAEMIKSLSEKFDLNKIVVESVLEEIQHGFIEELRSHGSVKLLNLGRLGIKKRPPRIARNPRTGELIQVPERYVVSFSASSKLKEAIHG